MRGEPARETTPARSRIEQRHRARMMMATNTSSRCEACDGGIGLWQAAFTAECAHTFHLRCVSGSAACPVCSARWSDTPASAPAPVPATPFSFAPPPPPSQSRPSMAGGLLGQTAAAAANSSSSSLFGPPTQATASVFSFTFPGGQPTPPPSFGGSLFAPRPPATPSPFWPDPAPPCCAVCGGIMGRGQASVTSECNHSFHLRCFSGSVCPLCSARWRDEVTVTSSSPQPSTYTGRPVFDDDEPVEQTPVVGSRDTAQEASHNGVLVLRTHCEHSAIPRDAARDNFAVLVHAKAPAAAAGESARAPLDLVTVLDVSGSMCGPKLALLKQATCFVIDNLGPGDRLSVVTFSCTARRIIRLTRMSDGGKASAKGAVESLFADGSTNIRDGLRVAAEVLDGRRHRNAVASIILLSDGQDNQTMCGYGIHGRARSYGDLVPHSLRRGVGARCTPVHTFGFGTDHDAAAMHAVAEVTGGTFSFIQNQAVLQDSFAQCIGGLLSVAVQEARVAVECLHPGVRVRAVKSGRYESRVDTDGRAASVDVGELYADEERRFLLLLDVPIAAGEGAEGGGVTRLIKASCTYRDASSGQSVDVACEDDAVVQRPVVVGDMEPSLEVARERFRVEAAEDIAAARAAADRGAHAEAARILDRRQEVAAAAGLAGDARCAALAAELRELSARVADRREYERTGRACLLAGMSSHAQQRAATVQLFGSAVQTQAASMPFSSFGSGSGSGASLFGFSLAGTPSSGLFGAAPPSPSASSVFGTQQAAPSFGSGYATPAMQSMVEASRKTREQ
ncbi:hypothetical protein ACP4OV_029996 [Aristida adscensionis]